MEDIYVRPKASV